MGPYADEFGFALLSPASAGSTWDAIQDGYGPDVRVIEKSLIKTFTVHSIDPKRIAVAGFSDGASYALGIGLSNGDLFRAIVSFSAGFVPAGVEEQGKPRIFMSHGTSDNILPIGNCSRRIAPALKSAGYTVEYREFDGPHTVPREIGTEAFKWFLKG
jgi:predicted esterase